MDHPSMGNGRWCLVICLQEREGGRTRRIVIDDVWFYLAVIGLLYWLRAGVGRG